MRLNTILHEVKIPVEAMEKPHLRPVYDEPEFLIRNVWRLYGRWYDGNPAELKPATELALAAENTRLAASAKILVCRAEELSAAGDHRLACHLAEMAAQSEPESSSVHGARAEIYEARIKSEAALMAHGIFAAPPSSRANGETTLTGVVMTLF